MDGQAESGRIATTTGSGLRGLFVGASCGVMMPVLAAYDSLREHPLMMNIGTYILPVICGLLIQVSVTMLLVSASVAESAGVPPGLMLPVVIAAIGLLSIVHIRKWVPDLLVLAGCAVASVVALSL